MTPSDWYGDAWRRPGAHDRMQTEVAALLRARPAPVLPTGTIWMRDIRIEYPLELRGQVVGYADVMDILTIGFRSTVHILEIKPDIATVAGTIRQCEAYIKLAEGCIPDVNAVVCSVVTRPDDPLLEKLREEWPLVWAWGAEMPEPAMTIALLAAEAERRAPT